MTEKDDRPRETQAIKADDVGSLDEVLGAAPGVDEPEEPQHAPEGPCFCGVIHKHRDGDCLECGGPCKGHPNIYCDQLTKTVCTHPPGSRRCDHTTLHDDDETSPQAREAKKQKTRRYSKDDA